MAAIVLHILLRPDMTICVFFFPRWLSFCEFRVIKILVAGLALQPCTLACQSDVTPWLGYCEQDSADLGPDWALAVLPIFALGAGRCRAGFEPLAHHGIVAPGPVKSQGVQ